MSEGPTTTYHFEGAGLPDDNGTRRLLMFERTGGVDRFVGEVDQGHVLQELAPSQALTTPTVTGQGEASGIDTTPPEPENVNYTDYLASSAAVTTPHADSSNGANGTAAGASQEIEADPIPSDRDEPETGTEGARAIVGAVVEKVDPADSAEQPDEEAAADPTTSVDSAEDTHSAPEDERSDQEKLTTINRALQRIKKELNGVYTAETMRIIDDAITVSVALALRVHDINPDDPRYFEQVSAIRKTVEDHMYGAQQPDQDEPEADAGDVPTGQGNEQPIDTGTVNAATDVEQADDEPLDFTDRSWTTTQLNTMADDMQAKYRAADTDATEIDGLNRAAFENLLDKVWKELRRREGFVNTPDEGRDTGRAQRNLPPRPGIKHMRASAQPEKADGQELNYYGALDEAIDDVEHDRNLEAGYNEDGIIRSALIRASDLFHEQMEAEGILDQDITHSMLGLRSTILGRGIHERLERLGFTEDERVQLIRDNVRFQLPNGKVYTLARNLRLEVVDLENDHTDTNKTAPEEDRDDDRNTPPTTDSADMPEPHPEPADDEQDDSDTAATADPPVSEPVAPAVSRAEWLDSVATQQPTDQPSGRRWRRRNRSGGPSVVARGVQAARDRSTLIDRTVGRQPLTNQPEDTQSTE